MDPHCKEIIKKTTLTASLHAYSRVFFDRKDVDDEFKVPF